MVNLIPKQEQKPLFGEWFFLIASVLLLAGAGAGFFVMNQLEENAEDVLASLDKRLAEEIEPQEKELIGKITAAKEKIERFRLAAKQREDVMPLFAFLEQTTADGVVLVSVEAGRLSDYVLIEGVAETFFVLEQQRLLWVQNSQIQKVDITEVELGTAGNIAFEVELYL